MTNILVTAIKKLEENNSLVIIDVSNNKIVKRQIWTTAGWN